ncbi:helix-turn-helix domain-containing protein [Dyadobacter subterraneus]|uniref:Helix-turn-helix transcriptional regulator n=1 Tax=Dyadobacter subterraneus TaxID=2773304 RepID=A0ABR9WMB5_9BACT|nr:helix-turn-helix transcriptional regulator [Dyadobacter subterraneus]MBE9465501.1 helix-turn-helix transcriptional regulator [Dyadobacter subterraneus]
MNQSSKTLLKKIASIRKANNVKAEDLAFLLDMPGETYKKLERGTGEVTLSQVFKIAEILKISAGILFDEI